ncbi:MAG: BatA domain-containing protein [Planctomycetota bacterium]
MTWLNALMATASLSFVVPLAIHLLYRNRFRTVDWGAMFLIKDLVQTNRRSMRWQQWILLLIRCAIPVLLALAMARPLVSSLQSAAGTAPLSLILAIDDSRSMSATGRRENLLASLNALLESLSSGDEVILVAASQPEASLTMSASRAQVKLSELPFDSGPCDLVVLMSRAVDACSDATYPHRKIILASDFQDDADQVEVAELSLDQGSQAQPSTSNGAVSRFGELRSRLDQMNPAVGVDWLAVGNQDASTKKSASDQTAVGNISIAPLVQKTPVALVGQPVTLLSRVMNHSDRDTGTLQCRWTIDDALVSEQTLRLEPNRWQTVQCEYTPSQAGNSSVRVDCQVVDRIAADNRRHMVLSVAPTVRVGMVSSVPNEKLQSLAAVEFLQLALTLGAKPNESPIQVERFSPRQFQRWVEKSTSSSDHTEAFDCWFWLNVASPQQMAPRGQVALLEDWMRNAPPVVFVDGDQVRSEDWNAIDLLPAKLGNRIRLDSETSLAMPDRRYSVWQNLANADDDLFASVQIKRRRVWPDADRTDASGTDDRQMWLSSITGDAVIVHDPTTKITQFAISCDDQDSTLPLRPVCVPILQQLVYDLSGRGGVSKVLPGEAIRLERSDIAESRAMEIESGTSEPNWQSMALMATDPLGRSILVEPLTAKTGWHFDDTLVSGVYQFDAPELRSPILRLVDVPASESTLGIMPEERRDALAEAAGARQCDDAETLLAATELDRYGREIWRPLMMATLALLIIELLWQQRRSIRPVAPMSDTTRVSSQPEVAA